MNPDILLAECELKVNERSRQEAKHLLRKAQVSYESQADIQTCLIEAPMLSEGTRKRLLKGVIR